MTQKNERLQWRFSSGTQDGGANSNTLTNESGWLTQSGCARSYRDIEVGPFDLGLIATACNSGSLYAASVLLDGSGSVFAGTLLTTKTYSFNMGLTACAASPATGWGYISKPTDAASSGSIIAYVDWTTQQAPATAGSKTTFIVALGYMKNDSLMRTAASLQGAASYSGTACGLMQTACIGVLPSWGASDVGAVVVAGITGTCSTGITTGSVHGIRVRFRYVRDTLGLQVNE